MPENYLDTHVLSRVFAANQLIRLADLISDQGDIMLREAGVEIPARAVSTFLLIGEREAISTADIAATLNQPHQLVTQRIELLNAAGVIKRATDPTDKRRKILELTDEGIAQFQNLNDCLRKADKAFAALANETGYDITATTQHIKQALEAAPLFDRVKQIASTN